MENTLHGRWRLFASLCLLVMLSLVSCGDDDDNAGGGLPGGEVPQDVRSVAERFGLGWNLGNSLDAYANGVSDETAWGNAPATQALFDQVAAAGFTSVRIPVTWMGHVGDAPDYQVEEAWMDRVATVVGYAEHAGLNVIVNVHHDGADTNNWLNIREAARNEAAKAAMTAKYKALWTQIATRFRDKGDFLMFEAFNELHDGDWGMGENRLDGGKQYAVIDEWNQVFVDAVRAAGGQNANRYLGIQGYAADAELAIDHLTLPTDPTPGRLLVSVHFYEPTEFTLTAAYPEWGHTAASGRYVEGGNEDNVQAVFAALKQRFVDQGIPVYVGEMGCVRHDSERSELFRRYYLEYVFKAAHDYGLIPFCWDNGYDGAGEEQSGLFDRATGNYLNDAETMVNAMKNAVFNTDASYTLQSVYDGAPE